MRLRCEHCKGAGGRYIYGAPGMWRPCHVCKGTGVAAPTQQKER